MAHRLLHGKMFVQGNGLRAGEGGTAVVQMSPAGLHHAQGRICRPKWGIVCCKKSGCGWKSASKMAIKSPVAWGKRLGQCARLEAAPLVAVQQAKYRRLFPYNKPPSGRRSVVLSVESSMTWICSLSAG
jgi:hypothetical protein